MNFKEIYNQYMNHKDNENENLLLNKIKQNDYDYDKLVTFNQRFNNHEDGSASKRVLEILLK